MRNVAKVAVIVIAVAAILAALFGLWYSGMSLLSASSTDFSDVVAQQGQTYFFPAYYTMSGICIACYLLMLVFAIGLLCRRHRWAWYLSGVLIFEVVYFISISILWMMPGIGMSVAAATGVANGGLMAQFITLFPFWAPPVLWWATRRLPREEAGG